MTQPIFQHIYAHNEQSYSILKVYRPYFIVPWHTHPEIELMHIVKGEGTRFVGDSIEQYEAGDVVLVGANLPHCWKSGPKHYDSETKLQAIAKVALFREDSFGKSFFELTEFKKIGELIQRAQRGIRFTGKTASRIGDKLIKAYGLKDINRFMAFMDILDDLSKSTDFYYLTSLQYKMDYSESDQRRLSDVMNYILNNYRNTIALKDIADKAYMTPSSFCRYFKAHTNKTVVQFINELRISYAQKLLTEVDHNISLVCYASGFQNTSNFYEQFKKIVGCTPFQYKKTKNGNFIGSSFLQ
ncbi:AraC family transcriptional regulator [Pedobacter sp. Hv1]|uniref:AraC family transcriptional regulator n=1 Tax=Pedobacter sp. Hv1 TaxID=1740090 RepID=UPI0006D8A599|nr:AraC family transcriptional regulator [Pedobacter sp. Hv1]KQC02181.1 hypothetical protein AQF98_00995 [Pedobacter sp. Hv1]